MVTAVHRVARRLNRWYDQQLADREVSTGEWTVLSELARAGDDATLTPSQLADAAHVAPSSMTHRLDRMETRGLVSRRMDPGNRTRILVGLTDAGWQLYADTIRESNLVERDLLTGLSDRQVGELAELLEQLLAGLDSSDSALPEAGPGRTDPPAS